MATSRTETATTEVDVEDHSAEVEGRPATSPRPRDGRAAETAAATSALAPIAIPDRRYFKIGEVADLLGVKPHVLRYWETEFREIRPGKSRHGQRLYRRRDVEILAVVRRLLHGERYTIAGARERLREILRGETAPPPIAEAPDVTRLERIEAEIVDLLAVLARRAADVGD